MNNIKFKCDIIKSFITKIKILLKDKYIKLILILFFFLFVLFGRPFISGDGYGYFGILDNVLSYGTVTTTSFDKYVDAPWTFQKLKYHDNPEYAPLYYHGGAISWAPFVIITRSLNSIGPVNEINNIFLTYTAFNFTDGMGVLLATSFMGLLSVIMTYKLLCMKFSPFVSFISSFLAFFGTYAFYYTFMEPSFVNVPEMFFITLALYLFVKVINTGLTITKRSFIYLVLVGLSFGLAITCRVSSVFVLGILGISVLFIFKKKFVKPAFAIGIGLILPLLSMLVFSSLAYGSPLISGMSYFSWYPLFSIKYFSLINILFDPIRGLFLWSPITLVSLISIVIGIKNNLKIKNILIFSLAIIALIILFYSFWYCWWGGGSIGQRFLIVLTPFWALGIAIFFNYVLEKYKNLKKIKIALVILTVLICFFHIFVGKSYLVMDKSKATYTKYEWEQNNPNSISPLEQYTIFDVLSSGITNFNLNSIGGFISLPKNLIMRVDLDGRRNFPQLVYYYYKVKVENLNIKDLELQKDNK